MHDMARPMHRRVGKSHHAVVFGDMMTQTLADISKRYLATIMPTDEIMVVTRDCMMLTYLPSANFFEMFYLHVVFILGVVTYTPPPPNSFIRHSLVATHYCLTEIADCAPGVA